MKRWRGRYDRGTLRAAGFVLLLTVVFLVTNTAVAAAADGVPAGSGLLGPLDIYTSEGVPLSGYQLDSSVQPLSVKAPGSRTGLAPSDPADIIGDTVRSSLQFDVIGETQRLLLSGLFTLVRLLVGLFCWLIGFVFDFPLLGLLTDPAQRLADAYQRHVVSALGLEGLLLTWAFVFGLILAVRGRVGKGLGEILLTLVIAALAASAFVRPDYLLGKDGPLQQAHQAAIEVASITNASYFDTPARGGRPCDTVVGPAHDVCVAEQADAKTVTTPIQAALTDALVVKPYMLLQYGRILDSKKEEHKAAYVAHLKWVSGNADVPIVEDADNPCALLDGPSKEYCESGLTETKEKSCAGLFLTAKKYCEESFKEKKENPCVKIKGPARPFCERKPEGGPVGAFGKLIKDLQDAGSVGEAAAAYAERPSWDRVWSVLALLVAVIVVGLMVVSMSVVMLGAQGADAAAAAGGPIAWVWAMLPGPSRMLLWRWLGVFVVSALVTFVAAMALPLFGIAVDAILADSGADQMMERLLLVDALALAFLVLHRRILRAATGFGQRMTTVMRNAKVGGNRLPAATASSGGSGGLGGGGRLASLAALTDGTGMPVSPGGLLGDAVAEGRRGIAPLAIALRGAHTALIGRKPAQHPAAAPLKAVANGAASSQPDGEKKIVDKETGATLYDPATDRPLLGSRIHARASRVRSYRIASRAARLGYGATLGLPRHLKAAKAGASEFTTDARTQLRVAVHRAGEDSALWAKPVDHVGQVVATAWQVHDPAGAVRDAAIATAIRVGPQAGSPSAAAGRPKMSASAAPHRVRSQRLTVSAAGSSQSGSRVPVGLTETPPARAQSSDPAPAPAPATPREESQARTNAARLGSVFQARADALRRINDGDQ
ncbi:hypothetical protein [Streptomyces venezuelae]|uniref:hypothetical protein n=1 Tax=Streptomyces venezuelae TaxID=54571 RepID=UPI003330A41A